MPYGCKFLARKKEMSVILRGQFWWGGTQVWPKATYSETQKLGVPAIATGNFPSGQLAASDQRLKTHLKLGLFLVLLVASINHWQWEILQWSWGKIMDVLWEIFRCQVFARRRCRLRLRSTPLWQVSCRFDHWGSRIIFCTLPCGPISSCVINSGENHVQCIPCITLLFP